MNQFDVVVIGSGPGGYVTAIRAAQLGMKTAIIEKEHFGGVCLNWGCIPTKALLKSAEVKSLIDHADEYGIEIKESSINLEKMVQRSRKISSQLADGIKHLLKKNKITVFNGHARFEKSNTLTITANDNKKEIVEGKHIIIATGARARLLPNVPSDHARVWTAKQAMVPTFTPKSLLIVGSGAIGIEFASFYRALGAEVTVVEIQNRILPQEDKEISDLALKMFNKRGIQFKLTSSVSNIKASDKNVEITVENLENKKQENITVEAVILAIGIIGNTEDLNLEKTKVKVERGQIKINEWGQTDESRIYAIGDVTGAPWLAHKASHEGIICIEKIAGVKDVHPLKTSDIPGCTYSTPQIASVGLTEAQAKEAGKNIKIGRFPFRANGKALALGEPEGLVKTIFDETTGELLGAHMIGTEVTEMIQGFVIAKKLETTEADLMHTIFPHPTLSEMMHESVLDAYGKVVHL